MNDEKQGFVCKVPSVVLGVLNVMGLILGAIFVALYFYDGSRDIMWIVGGALFAGPIFLFTFTISLNQLKVDGTHLVYTSLTAGKRHSEIGQITHYTVIPGEGGGRNYRLYDEKGLFAKVSYESTNTEALEKYLTDHGVEQEASYTNVITKWNLIWKAIRELMIIIGVISIIAGLVTFIVGVNARNTTSYSVGFIAALSVGEVILLLGLVLLCVLPIPLVGILRLSAQERQLHFRFREEAESNNIRSTSFKNKNWFLAVGKGRVIAFHRDYIKSLYDNEVTYLGRGISEIKLITTTDKIIKVKGSLGDIQNLKLWILDSQ